MSRPSLVARDYKRRHRARLGIEPARLRMFGVGLAAGLVIAGIVFVADHRAPIAALDATHPPSRRALAGHGVSQSTAPASTGSPDAAAASAADTTSDDAAPSEGKYDFYQMLPKFEVVVPEREHGTRLASTAQIDRPGVYFLQVGSYRDAAVAERIRAQLAKLGIDATVQRVAVDADVWHRVRVGPIRDLALLNRLRRQLQAGDLDSLVIRVDD